MTTHEAFTPKKRINAIDALRGFALFGILMFHCMEHFDLVFTPEIDSPFWSAIDTSVFNTLAFLFAGKAYAIFSLLYGLSFFMQLDSQASKGHDFRGRFLWRSLILLALGYINGLVYMGEFFVVYALLGIVLVPLCKLPTRWLVILAGLMFLQLPEVIGFILLLSGNSPNEPTVLVTYMGQLYDECFHVFEHGSFKDVILVNVWKGLVAKFLWIYNYARYPQLIGLFISGMLIGRYGIHKSEEKMIEYSKKILPYSILFFVFFYGIMLLLPALGVQAYALELGKTLFKTYANLGLMMMYVSGIILLYYKTKLRKGLDLIAPVGRMSVTNYMVQSFIGVTLFYGFGGNLAVQLTFLQSMLLGLTLFSVQIVYSNFCMKRAYYGPMEWLWRRITWFRPVPFLRK